jgi:DNA replication protein DnaC
MSISQHIPTFDDTKCSVCKVYLYPHEQIMCDKCDASRTELAKKELVKAIPLTAEWPDRHKSAVDTYHGPAKERAETLWSSLSLSPATLVLYGARGRGKTGMATYWAWRRGKEGKNPGTYATAYELFQRIRRSWHPTSKEAEWDALMPYKTTPYLVIDQLHQCRALGDNADKSAMWERMALAEVLDYRYRQSLTTILIATLETEAELKSALDADILDRIKESGGIVKCDWPSYR